ncbi:MAG: hypothetical protein ACXQS5_04225 [Candidatus Methanospirareceae archaeon]
MATRGLVHKAQTSSLKVSEALPDASSKVLSKAPSEALSEAPPDALLRDGRMHSDAHECINLCNLGRCEKVREKEMRRRKKCYASTESFK